MIHDLIEFFSAWSIPQKMGLIFGMAYVLLWLYAMWFDGGFFADSSADPTSSGSTRPNA